MIKIKEDVKIGDIILEKGDKIKVLEAHSSPRETLSWAPALVIVEEALSSHYQYIEKIDVSNLTESILTVYFSESFGENISLLKRALDSSRGASSVFFDTSSNSLVIQLRKS